MRRSLLLVALALTVPSVAVADYERKPYLQDARPDGMILMWKTRGASAATIVVTAPDGKESRFDVKSGVEQRFRVTGLEPATRYRYQVTAGGAVASGELTTAPEPGAQVPVTFVVFGDSRSDAVAHYELVERVRAEVPDFILSTGDMVFDGGEEKLWKQFFDIEGPLLADNVLYPALGNHDWDDNSTGWVERLFSPPADRQAPGQYAFTYGPVRVIVLESNTPSYAMTDETAWLERQLLAYQQDPKLRHLFLTMHHPVYSISSHGGLTSLREKWAPLFEKYGASAVFSGHDHCYQRAEHGGVRYFVTGGAGAPLYGIGKRVSATDAAVVVRQETVHHYIRVHIVGDTAEVTAVRDDGTPIETLTFASSKAKPADAVGQPAADVAMGAAAPLPLVPPTADVTPAPTADVPAAAAPVRTGHRLPPRTLLGLGGLALLAAVGLWRLTRPEPRRA